MPLELFGGALEVQLPTPPFRDVSDYFPIEDNQEVFQLPQHPDVVFTVEILERVEELSDEEVPLFFLKDTAKTEKDAEVELEEESMLSVPKSLPCLYGDLDETTSKARCMFACEVRGKRFCSESDKSKTETGDNHSSAVLDEVRLCVVRLAPPVSAEITLSLVYPSSFQKKDQVLSEDQTVDVNEVWAKAMQTFRINDWGLFCCSE